MQRINAKREAASLIAAHSGTETFTVPAAGVLEGIYAAARAGYYWPPSEVPTPLRDQLATLERDGSPVALATFRVRNSIGLQFEEKCIRISEGLKGWSEQPTEAEIAAEARSKRDAAEREAAIEARAQDLLASENTKRVEAARAKARKEMEATNG